MKEALKILILEDLVEDVELVSRSLKREDLQFEIVHVDTREEFINSLKTFKPDVVLSDHALPKFNSIEAFKICKGEGTRIPFILVTGTVSEEFAVNILKQGADDYVLKSNLSRLPSAITQALSKLKAEREKQEAEAELLKQNLELSKVNKELDNFVYSISHNLRSPLVSVMGLIHLAKMEGDESSPWRKYLSMMETSLHQLDGTLKDILTYSRNSRNQIDLEKVDVQALIDRSFDVFATMNEYKSVIRDVEVKGGAFYSDPYRLSILFRNLISNSITFRNQYQESINITIRVAVTAKQVMITFIDNGVGIRAEHLSRVFDMFFRGSERSKGAGLGLYIVREVIQRLNGTIQIESKLDEGTTVSITLPNKKPGSKSTDS